uniref:UDP-galactose transporter n=1 Tax=Alexandrium catenella TaxID=2925 RepID=A0A7S1WLM2_ALECA|eukprot:CAMPEP_0171173294 /NCGR_PEP_ID=MMETSP0790-20130122/10151_1 /TAXON_ID=2925 /ORGANISM="Alexandrium catenella, Strain OF101" /LENGTH=420 /DNA_ID=CAMNT_0011638159 /DNA_START=59 /DNA_END=1321 /DNA_ORIENTATION=+
MTSVDPVVVGAAGRDEDLEGAEGKQEEDHEDILESNENTRIMEEHKEIELANENGHTEESPMKEGVRDGDLPKIEVKAAPEPEATLCGIPMKWMSLILLTVQTSGQALLIRWSKSQKGTETPYLSSTVVFWTEVLKTVCSLGLVVMESESVADAAKTLTHHFTDNPCEVMKAGVPALIYTIQNNLMFYSFDKLSAPVQQVLYQMKILTTAGLGVLMLGKSLTATKWGSCFLLAAGVAFVEWPRDALQAPGAAAAAGGVGADQIKGFVAVLLACFTSGFAAVFIQKMLQQTTASIWVRNIQFGLFGSIMGLLVALGSDGQKILKDGFLQGYNIRVVSVIAMNAIGGLLCAVMLKYAGATLGCFSTAMSIILTCVCSWLFLQDFTPDSLFLLGTFLAIAASLLFGLGLPEWLTGRCGGTASK